jgi:putative transposase
MARLSRLVIPRQPHLITQISNGLQAAFRTDGDYRAYLGWLREAARSFKVALHAYALLPERVHLLATPSDDTGLGRMMQWVGRHYVPYFNNAYQRAGGLWQGRYKATVIEPDRFLLPASLFIECLPVQTGLTDKPVDYPWSSCAHHAGMRPDPVITDHPIYWALGNTPFDRELAYRALLDLGLSAQQTAALQQATRSEWPLGSAQFVASLEKQAMRRVAPGKRGRPRAKGLEQGKEAGENEEKNE